MEVMVPKTHEDDEGISLDIPLGSKIITSEEVFSEIIKAREENARIDKKLKTQVNAGSQTASKFVTERV